MRNESVRNARVTGQTRQNNAARWAAIQRLIAAHRQEYRAIFIEECEKRGVTAAPTTGLVTKRERVSALIEEVKASGVLDLVDLPDEYRPPERFIPDAPIVARQRMTRADQLDVAAAGVAHQDQRPEYVPVPPPPF